jgi:hypothetical protein
MYMYNMKFLKSITEYRWNKNTVNIYMFFILGECILLRM